MAKKISKNKFMFSPPKLTNEKKKLYQASKPNGESTPTPVEFSTPKRQLKKGIEELASDNDTFSSKRTSLFQQGTLSNPEKPKAYSPIKKDLLQNVTNSNNQDYNNWRLMAEDFVNSEFLLMKKAINARALFVRNINELNNLINDHAAILEDCENSLTEKSVTIASLYEKATFSL